MSEKPDFIEIYNNAMNDELCDSIIRQFDIAESTGQARTRKSVGDNEVFRSDTFMFSPEVKDYRIDNMLEEHRDITDVLWECWQEYSKKYSILNASNAVNVIGKIKIQKTRPGEGYHIWHCENLEADLSNRVSVFTIYLNDEFEAGETEFLYQQKRVKPKKGSVVIWPAGYTHTHRGNPPIGGTKYILTGWFHC